MQQNLMGERYKYPVSDNELNRRLAAVQAAMKAEDVDCVITQNHCPIFDGGIRYFTDMPTGSYSSVLLIPASGKMVYLVHGDECDDAPIPDSNRNIGKLIRKPYCQPFTFSDSMAAETMVQEIRARGFKKVGLYGMQFISLSFGEHLKHSLPNVEFVDFSQQIINITSVKSEEEWELIDKAMRAHEHLVDALRSLIRPGKMEFDIRADLVRLALSMGCDYIGNIAVGSAPANKPSRFVGHYTANRLIQPGDNVTVMVEVSGPGGMYGELARTFCLGEPTEEFQRLYEIAVGCQHAIAEAAKPGVTGSQLNDVFNEYVTRYGIGKNLRFGGHGQGYDMMEMPAICGGDHMPLKENMLLAIHPELTLGNDFAIACDNFRVTADGAVRLGTTPQELIRLRF